MPSIFYLSWIKKRKTKNNCLQTSGNCHPKSILALEIVVGEKNFDLLLSILEREISQQFQVSCFACTQFIRSIWDTRGRRISPLVGILRLRKWPKRLYFPLSSEAVSNRYCRTCSDLFTISVNVWENSYCFNDLGNVFRNLPRVRKSILTAVNLLDTKKRFELITLVFWLRECPKLGETQNTVTTTRLQSSCGPCNGRPTALTMRVKNHYQKLDHWIIQFTSFHRPSHHGL